MRVLARRIAGWKAEEIADRRALGVRRHGDEPPRLDHRRHQVGGVGQVALAPDGDLQRLEPAQGGDVADRADDGRLTHGPKTSRLAVTLSRKARSSVTPVPGPGGTGMIPSAASSRSATMSRAK